ncbi:MAG: alpha/beta fold hydrolase [Hyphomicrobiales bacterium]
MTVPRGEIRLPDGTSALVAGEGPALVLLHGVGLDRRIWAAQVHALARRHMVVTYDLLGHGKSPPVMGEACLDDWVMQLERLARALRIERFSLVGFSFGGMIAQGFALRHPRRLERLVLMSTVHDRSAEERAGVAARLKLAREATPAAIIPAALERWFSPAFAAGQPEIVQEYSELLRSNDPASFLAAYGCFANADCELAGRLGAISCPTLVMTGEFDTGSTPQMARKMAKAIANAKLSILALGRHMMPVEMADEVNAILLGFLDGGAA